MKLAATFCILLLLSENVISACKQNEEEPFKPSISPLLKVQFWNVASQGTSVGDKKTDT